MLINFPQEKRIVVDYDIVYNTGLVYPLRIDAKYGDTVKETKTRILVYLAPKPSPTDPNNIMAATKITIYKQHLASIQCREQEITEQTPEQKLAWEQFKKQASGSVN